MSQCDNCPAIVRQVIDRLHVSASQTEVSEAMRKAFKKRYRDTPAADEAVKRALAHHQHNQAIYNWVMLGHDRPEDR